MNVRVAPAAPVTVLLVSGLVACSSTTTGTSQPTETATVTASTSATTGPTVTVTATPTPDSPVTSKSPSVQESRGGSATFEHFKVTVSDVDYESASEPLVRAEVCVRSLPPNPQGNRTRISWDPWSVTAGTRASQAGYRGDTPEHMFPSDATYAVGECASGWIPFPIQGDLDIIRYANGVGDRAVWDADHLDRQPATRHQAERHQANATTAGIGEGTWIVGQDIEPGRYQASAGSDGYCYWARLKDDTGDFDSILANDATSGRASVTLKASDGAFETSGCTPWRRR